MEGEQKFAKLRKLFQGKRKEGLNRSLTKRSCSFQRLLAATTC